MLLFWLATAFILGDVGGGYAPAPAPWLPLAVCGAAGLAAIRVRGAWRLWALACVALGFGIVISPHPSAPLPHSVESSIGQSVDVMGIVSAEPDPRGRTTIYAVTLSTQVLTGRNERFSGKIDVRASAATDLQYGDQVELKGVLRTIPGPAGATLRREGIAASMSFPKVSDLGPAATGLAGVLVAFRQHIESGIDRWLPEPEAALLIAISLGARSASLGDLAHPLVVTGLIHLVAVSGIKVSLFAGMAYQLTRRVGNRFLASGAPLALLWMYVGLTGFTASGVRSAIMWTLVFTATALGRKTVALVSLGVAVACMTALTPGLPWDTGFQLSAIGTAFIVAYADVVSRVTRFIPSPFGEAFAVTVAAQIGTLPIVIAGFHVASTTGPFANALVLPLVPVLIVLGFAVGLLASVQVLVAPLAATANILCSAIIAVAQFGAAHSPPYSLVTLPSLVTAMYYAVAGYVAIRLLRRVRWAPRQYWKGLAPQFTVSGLVAVGGLAMFDLRVPHPPSIVSLGSGDSVLIQTQGRAVLIDGGPNPFALLEHLGQLLPPGDRTIDLVVDSDPRSANVLGLMAVERAYRVKAVLDVGAEYPGATYAQWRDQLRQDGVPTYALRTGSSSRIGALALTAIGPDAVCPLTVNCVGMLRLSMDGSSYLFSGAASALEQHEAVFRPVVIRARVLIGAPKAFDPDFVQAVGAMRTFVPAATGPVRAAP